MTGLRRAAGIHRYGRESWQQCHFSLERDCGPCVESGVREYLGVKKVFSVTLASVHQNFTFDLTGFHCGDGLDQFRAG